MTAPNATTKPATKATKKPASKKPASKKSTVKVINDGFIQRNAAPATAGRTLKSRMVRVDADFAEYMRQEAMKAGVSITEVSRSIFQSLTD